MKNVPFWNILTYEIFQSSANFFYVGTRNVKKTAVLECFMFKTHSISGIFHNFLSYIRATSVSYAKIF